VTPYFYQCGACLLGDCRGNFFGFMFREGALQDFGFDHLVLCELLLDFLSSSAEAPLLPTQTVGFSSHSFLFMNRFFPAVSPLILSTFLFSFVTVFLSVRRI